MEVSSEGLVSVASLFLLELEAEGQEIYENLLGCRERESMEAEAINIMEEVENGRLL